MLAFFSLLVQVHFKLATVYDPVRICHFWPQNQIQLSKMQQYEVVLARDPILHFLDCLMYHRWGYYHEFCTQEPLWKIPSFWGCWISQPLSFSTETHPVVCGCVCPSVCLSFCDAWVCTDHEIYVVAVIIASWKFAHRVFRPHRA